MVILKSLAANSSIWVAYDSVPIDLFFYLTMSHIFLILLYMYIYWTWVMCYKDSEFCNIPPKNVKYFLANS